jgi:TolA-binding protein
MELQKKSRQPRFLGRVFVLALLGLPVCPFSAVQAPQAVWAAATGGEEISPELLAQREEKLWQEAEENLLTGKDEEAAEFFVRFYRKFPESPRAEEALWQAANLYREVAITRADGDWEKVQELFRSFTIDYPQSAHLADAYFEVADSYIRMGYDREALAYLNLYIKRFADTPRFNEARAAKARLLMKIGRLPEAAAAFRELSQSPDEICRLRGQAGLAHIDFLNKKFQEALTVYRQILKQRPSFYVEDPELLRNKGLAGMRLGKVQEGRKDLLQYLNIAGDHDSRPETLFELAEGFMAEGQTQTARSFYEQAIAEGKPGERPVVLSRLRLALGETAAPGPAAQGTQEQKEEALPVEADKVLHDVLDLQYNDPLSQDARFELVRRYWVRREYDQAYDTGKAYLRYETAEAEKKEVADIMGQILAMRMEKLFQAKKYEAVYQLYREEYPYVKLYRRATLLYLTGRSLEELGLYRQAGIIYYGAMALELTAEEQLDLYIHRAQAYLADNDISAANRLLKYLRKVYADKPAMGEICFLSGRLREKQNRGDDALHFYQLAVENPAIAEKKGEYAANYLRLLFARDRILDKAQMLDTFQKEKWLPPQEMQEWYGKLAARYRRNNDWDKAAGAYLAALAEQMPQDGAAAQQLRLDLGDVLLRAGRGKEALTHFSKAAEGPDDLVRKRAAQRMAQQNIDRAMAETEAVWKQ